MIFGAASHVVKGSAAFNRFDTRGTPEGGPRRFRMLPAFGYTPLDHPGPNRVQCMDWSTIALFVGGLALLVAGAEGLVRGAGRLAAIVGVSPLVIGLTIVAYGTSAPELAVSVKAALAGQPDLGLGNVVGSNLFNVLFILGLSALITPLAVAQQLVRLDAWVMTGVSLAALLLGLDGRVGRVDGLVLVAGGVAYTAWCIRQGRRENAAVQAEYAAEFGPPPRAGLTAGLVNVALVLVGLTLLVLGSRWLVASSVVIARALGVSELVIGLTIVAAGTSLPEVATSVVAALKGERDIAVGNVVGSNIFNILIVLGGAAVVAPQGVAVARAALIVDMPLMIVVSAACLPIFFTGYRISRPEGALFLVGYVAYTAYLVLAGPR